MKNHRSETADQAAVLIGGGRTRRGRPSRVPLLSLTSFQLLHLFGRLRQATFVNFDLCRASRGKKRRIKHDVIQNVSKSTCTLCSDRQVFWAPGRNLLTQIHNQTNTAPYCCVSLSYGGWIPTVPERVCLSTRGGVRGSPSGRQRRPANLPRAFLSVTLLAGKVSS